MDKSLFTNLVALLLVIVGLNLSGAGAELVLNTGLFALSGGLTNWLAIHMLFEKVPGFYGSGVIPARFEEFKSGIKALIMEQFFTPENINGFFRRIKTDNMASDASGLAGLIRAVDLSSAFDALTEVIMASSFGSMLSMFGGRGALQPLKEPFVEKMRGFLAQVAEDPEVLDNLRDASSRSLQSRIEHIVELRLDELTPQLVKEIIQRMIRRHLGWLVVWGGVLGGIIGLLATVLLN
ncbi:MAG: hypothetical protein RQ899_14405 [Pseudomonadales bacterium]|nr:hypothetical protein [Pseudomonadales bacterium]